MSINPEKEMEFSEIFRQIAEYLNRLTPEKRAELRKGLGEYSHDLKHILGVVMGAQSLIQLDDDSAVKHVEELDISIQSLKDLNAMFDIMVHNLSNQIELEA